MSRESVIPGRATDLGFTRDWHLMVRRSATADLRGASPESCAVALGYCRTGFRVRGLRPRPGMTTCFQQGARL
jgi:hypothetical protein